MLLPNSSAAKYSVSEYSLTFSLVVEGLKISNENYLILNKIDTLKKLMHTKFESYSNKICITI